MSGELRVLSSGVDTLYFSAKGALRQGLLEALEACRVGAGGRPERFEFGADGTAFRHNGHGWHGYRHWLTGSGFDVMVGASEVVPPVYVQVRSAFIHELGASGALAEIVACLETHFFEGGLKAGASRLDVYADVQGWDLRPADFERFVTRATRRTQYDGQGGEGEMFEHGRWLSGFSFGRGDFMARVYDKRREMAVSRKDWLKLVWQDEDPDASVWRIEFQARRSVLAAMGLGDAATAVRSRQGLWNYGTDWLSFRNRSGHARPCRWPVSAIWDWVQKIQLGEPCEPLVRERADSADLNRLLAVSTGCLTSYAARLGLAELEATSSAVSLAASRYLDQGGRRFETEVKRKRSLMVERRSSGARRGA
jgi:hypothetical protein